MFLCLLNALFSVCGFVTFHGWYISLVDRKGNVPKLELLFFLVSNAVVFAGGKCNCITKTSGEAILD